MLSVVPVEQYYGARLHNKDNVARSYYIAAEVPYYKISIKLIQ